MRGSDCDEHSTGNLGSSTSGDESFGLSSRDNASLILKNQSEDDMQSQEDSNIKEKGAGFGFKRKNRVIFDDKGKIKSWVGRIEQEKQEKLK